MGHFGNTVHIMVTGYRVGLVGCQKLSGSPVTIKNYKQPATDLRHNLLEMVHLLILPLDPLDIYFPINKGSLDSN